MCSNLNVLIITSEYPTEEHPEAAPFISHEVDYLRAAGVNIDVFAFRGQKRLTNYFSAWVTAHRKMRIKKYDLVHAQFGQSALLALFPKVYPLIITFRGSDVEGILDNSGRYTVQGRLLQLVSRFTAMRADECILVSKSMMKKMPKRDYYIIPSGLDLELFKPQPKGEARKKLNLSNTKQYILFGGNPIQPVKRYDLALKVLQFVQAKNNEIEMIVPRGVPHSEMLVYLNACDVLLMTSSHEGSPNIVKEALACNLPIVSTNVGDVKERIGNIEGCYVNDSAEPDKIANNILQVLQLNRRIEGRNHVLSLDEKSYVNKILDVYHKAAKRKLK